MELKNKKIIILGISGTLGKNIAEILLSKGAQIVGIDKTDLKINSSKKNNLIFLKKKIDSKSESRIAKSVYAPEEMDILINCLNILGKIDYSQKLNKNDIEKSMENNFYAPFNLIKSFLKSSKNKEKILVHISSLASQKGLPFHLPYSISKSAMDKFILCLAAETNTSRNKLIIIYPKTFRSRLAKESLQKVKPFFKREKINLNTKKQKDLHDPKIISNKIVSIIEKSKLRFEKITVE